MFKMDNKTLEIMIKESGIRVSEAYCPFIFEDNCKIPTGLCDTEHYRGCSNYSARVIEAWRDKIRKEKKLVTV